MERLCAALKKSYQNDAAWGAGRLLLAPPPLATIHHRVATILRHAVRPRARPTIGALLD
jgi:hypothetical protein